MMRVLYIEDNINDIELTRNALRKQAPHIVMDTAATQTEALAKLSRYTDYDLLLTDMNLPDGDGLAIVSHVRGKSLPLAVVMITGKGDEETAVAALKAGADDYVVKKGGYRETLPRIFEKALAHFKTHSEIKSIPLRVLYVEDERVDIELLSRHLSAYASNIHLDVVMSRKALLKLLPEQKDGAVPLPWDVLILDLKLPDVNSLELLKEIRHARDLDFPIIILTGKGDEEVAVCAFHLGIADYVVKQRGYLEKMPWVIYNAYHSYHLAKKNEALLESQAKYRRVIESSPIGIAVHQNGKVVFANSAFTSMFGYEPDEIQGLSIGMLLDDSDSQNVLRFVDQINNAPAVSLSELKGRKKDNTAIDLSVRLAGIEHQKEPAVLGFWIDVSNDKILRNQLFRAQKLEALGTLAGGIAHDFNNILTIIMGHAEMAAGTCPQDDPMISDMTQILRAGARAKDLVGQILDICHKSDQKFVPVILSSIVKEVCQMMRASLPSFIEIRQNIIISEDADPGMILADSGQIHQVLINLFTNASHAMNEKGGAIDVDLIDVNLDPRSAPMPPDLLPGPYLKLSVRDTGCGIDPSIADRIFDPYFTTKKVGQGTGLGLAVVLGIVKAHKGAVTVESQPGKGAVFHVFLPRISAGKKAVVEKLLPIQGGTERILFVDDEDAIVGLWAKILTPLGYDVKGTTSSTEALEIFRAAPDRFDLVITDQTMPHMSGMDLARELLKIRPGIPIILCTGFSPTATQDRAREIGIREFLLKPLQTRTLTEAIRRALKRNDE